MLAYVTPDPAAGTIEAAELPIPEVGAGELLVRMRAIGVGIHDSYFLPSGAAFPFVIGIEGAGVVEQVGSDVTGHAVGDAIAFVSSMQPKGGTWAEYAVVDAGSLIIPVSDDLGFVRAAALPVIGNTVLRAFAAIGDLPEGAVIFVAGGSGAIGSLAVQLARRRGWRVAASASAANHDYLRSLGVEATFDYRDGTWTEQVRAWLPEGVHAALAVQPGTTGETVEVVRDGGCAITISGDSVTSERDVRVAMIDYAADVRDDLARLVADVASGELHLEVERVYPFADADEALARVQTRHVRGKLVIELP